MRTSLTGVLGVVVAGLALVAAADNGAQDPFGDAKAMVEFQRAADAYAFSHRQIERRGAATAVRAEGAIFTPVVAAAFRARIVIAAGRHCELPRPSQTDFVVPRVNAASAGTGQLPPCVAEALPRLPPELEYRVSGIALLLADAHLGVIVDVLHAAFPAGGN
jgi:hypothetical protein